MAVKGKGYGHGKGGNSNARPGSYTRTTAIGTAAYNTPALARFPPPEFLTKTQSNIWVAALADISLEFFRARHIPMMIQYVRAVEHMMKASDEFEEDPEDQIARIKWERMFKLAAKLERHLSLHTENLISMVVRSRSELRVQHETKRNADSGDEANASRTGLIYAGY
jgi:hypothetical protein